MNRWTRLIFILVCFLNLNISYSQLNLYIRNVSDNVQYTTDPWQYPTLKTRIRAELNGTAVKLNLNNVFILENNNVCQPYYIGDFEKDTISNEQWQLVKWYTRKAGANILPGNEAQTIIVAYDNQIAQISSWHPRSDLSYVRFHDYQILPIIEKEFKYGEPGSSQNENIVVEAMAGMIDGSGYEGQVWIDSITVNNDNFRIKWDGWINDKRPPPLHIWVGMPYYVRVYYEPKDNNYHTGKVTIFYDHGAKSELMLIGHEYFIPNVSNSLKLIYPNGNESFAPCQEIEIKWDGYIRGMATYIDFSSNGGSTWENVGLSEDSAFIWTVPNVKSKSALIRVRQSFNSSYPVELKIDESPVYKITFNYDGSRLLSAHSSGIITSWNTITEKEYKRYYLNEPSFPANSYIQTGLSYINSDSLFAVTYYKLNDYPQKDSLAIFDINDSLPILRTELTSGFNTQKVYFDSQKELIALLTDIGTKIKIFSVKNGEFIKDLIFESPISAFTFSEDKRLAAIALWNGEIQILSVPEFNIIQKLNYSDFPLIVSMSLAPNGKFLAIGCKSAQKTKFADSRTDVFVVNLPTNQVIRRMRKIVSDPVAMKFSPQSTKLLIGQLKDHQITYWDLPVDNVINNFIDHDGLLTDFAFSPRGSMIATSSNSRNINLYLRRFTYSESDVNDTTFNIITPDLTIQQLKIEPAFLAESKNFTFNNAVCVNEKSLIYLQVDSLTLKYGKSFSIIQPIPKDTLIFPGECLSINLNFYPLVAGTITDTLYIHSCGTIIPIPLNSKGLERNIELITQELEFEPTCMGEIIIKEFPVAINKDPVPLLVNKIEVIKTDYTPFLCLNDENIIYQPGDTIVARIRFEPYALREGVNDLIIYHSNQTIFTVKLKVRGKGIGTEYELSHYDLRFIPEILDRQLQVINNSDNEIIIEQVNFNNPDLFELKTPLPLKVNPKTTENLDIHWNIENGIPNGTIYMTIIAGPCAEAKNVIIGLYSADSKIDIPDVAADPKGRTTIKINYKNDTQHPYNGNRFFEGEIIINPRLFLPDKVTCPYGEGQLIKNEIYNDRRIIGFKVEGNLPEEGTAAEIHGFAGLAEKDTSHINILPNGIFWGKSVTTILDFAVFRLINITPDRLVIHSYLISNLIINPNPSSGIINLAFKSKIDGEFNIKIFSSLGKLIKEFNNQKIFVGENNLSLNLSELKSGIYNGVLHTPVEKINFKIIIIK